jgi:GDP-mannose 6-dehydrogenase
LREGSAVADFMEPSLIVVGSDDPGALEAVAGLYAPLKTEICRVSLRTAEMIKYACNSFHAIKIGFANEIGALCERLGVPSGEVMASLCKDRKLNISPAYLRPGFAFGGSCLPKDLRALNYRAANLGINLPLVGAVLPSNEEHLRRAMETVAGLASRKIGIFGLAFKENTDDLRESPVVPLLNRLLQSGKEVRIYDPHIQLDRIYGSNRNYAVTSIPQMETMLECSLEKLLAWAGHIVLTQTPAPEQLAYLAQGGLPILDLAGGTAEVAALY